MRCKLIAVLILLVVFAFLFLPAQADSTMPSGTWGGSFLIPGYNQLLNFRVMISEDQQDTLEITYKGETAVAVLKNISENKYRLNINDESSKKAGHYFSSVNTVDIRPFLSDESEYWLKVNIDTLSVSDGNGGHGVSFFAAPEGFFDRPLHSANEDIQIELNHEAENIRPVFCTDDLSFIESEWFDYNISSGEPLLIRFQLDNEHDMFAIDELVDDLLLLADDHGTVKALKTILPQNDGEDNKKYRVFDLVYILYGGREAEALLVNGKAYDIAGLPREADKLGQKITPETLLDQMYYLAGDGENPRIYEGERLDGTPFIQGKMLVGIYINSRTKYCSTAVFSGDDFYGLEEYPDRLAKNIDEAGTIVLIAEKSEQAGKYDNGGLAYRTYTYMYIMNMEQNGSWARILVAKEDPPESGYVRTGSPGGLSGEFKPYEAVEMLLDMEYVP